MRVSLAFAWNEECQSCFDQMKEILCSELVLAIYDPEKKCFLFTNASKVEIGEVLKQLDDNNLLRL